MATRRHVAGEPRPRATRNSRSAHELIGAPVPEGGFFLWLDVGDGEEAAVRLWQRRAACRTIPGAYLVSPAADGCSPGRSFLRVAMVQDLETTTEALARMARVLG